MKIISWNINGLRAIYKKNFLEWFQRVNADIMCVQEIKIQEEQLSEEMINLEGYNSYFNFALKKGYGGVAVYTKKKPLKVEYSFGMRRFDQEGRMLKLIYPGFTLFNFYIPHGGREKENLKYKLEVYRRILRYLNKNKNKNIILVGDFNIAHREIDLARPGNNKKNIMFTETERKQIDALTNIGFVDTFRNIYKEGGYYTWWPYFAKDARERNLGWRLDYVFASKKLVPKIKKAFILKQITGSDHCPIGVEL